MNAAVEPSQIATFIALLQQMLGDAQAANWGLGALVVIASKYLVDVLRSPVAQLALSAIEKALGLRPGKLQWARWSQSTRVWVSLVQSFLVAFVPALAVMSWPAALIAALVAAFATKGTHDSGVLPGRKPTVYEPSFGRAASLSTPPAQFRR